MVANLMGDIMNNMLDSLESLNIPECKTTILEARQAVRRVVARYRSCENLHQDNPPSKLQKTLKFVCFNVCHMNLGTEMLFVFKDFGTAYAKRGFDFDRIFDFVKEYLKRDGDNLVADIIEKFATLIFQQNRKHSVDFFEDMLQQAQETFAEALSDLDLEEVIADVVSQFLSSPHKKYSKTSRYNSERSEETLKEILMENLDLDEYSADILMEYLTSSQSNSYIENILKDLLEEID